MAKEIGQPMIVHGVRFVNRKAWVGAWRVKGYKENRQAGFPGHALGNLCLAAVHEQ